MAITILVLALYFVIAFLPKVPWYVKVLAQIGIGLVIYFGFADTSFDLPMGEKLPMSTLFGGNAYPEFGSYNKYAFGILGTILGLLATIVATILYAIIGKKSEDS